MPQRPRDTAPGPHHVIVGSVTAEKYFRDDVDYVAWTRRLVRVLDRHKWTCLILCQLTTHAHAILDIPDESLPRGMQWLNGEYARDFNARHGRSGALARGRYWSRRITSDADLLCTFAYVAWNPVKAGVAPRPEDWPQSSYATTVGEAKTFSFVDASLVLSQLGSTPETATTELRALVKRDGPNAALEPWRPDVKEPRAGWWL